MLFHKAVSLLNLFKETPLPQKKRARNCKTYDIEYVVENPDRAIPL